MSNHTTITAFLLFCHVFCLLSTAYRHSKCGEVLFLLSSFVRFMAFFDFVLPSSLSRQNLSQTLFLLLPTVSLIVLTPLVNSDERFFESKNKALLTCCRTLLVAAFYLDLFLLNLNFEQKMKVFNFRTFCQQILNCILFAFLSALVYSFFDFLGRPATISQSSGGFVSNVSQLSDKVAR